MGEMITKPDANPIILGVCNWFFFGALGYFLMGQQKKAMIAVVVTFVSAFLASCTFGLLSPIVPIWIIICAYDAYLLGTKLQSGESIGINENGLDFLNAIFKD